MATIQSTEKLIVSVKIPEYAIGKVSVGMAVNLTSDAVAGTISGTLSRISPTASEGENGGFAADVTVNQSNSLFIGSKAKAEVIISSKTERLYPTAGRGTAKRSWTGRCSGEAGDGTFGRNTGDHRCKK